MCDQSLFYHLHSRFFSKKLLLLLFIQSMIFCTLLLKEEDELIELKDLLKLRLNKQNHHVPSQHLLVQSQQEKH